LDTQYRLRLPRNPFLDAVYKSGLLPPDDLIEILSQFDPDEVAAADPIQIATFLVRKKRLTKFQAMQLLSGRTQGFLLGPYKVLEGIRQDRVGMVFLAEHTETKEKVAVKVLPTDRVMDPTVFKPFVEEVRTAAKVKHPNVARIIDMRSTNGTHYVACEYVASSTLDKVVAQRGPLPAKAAARIIAQVAIGLMHVHEKGILHRDIKPGNIAVSPDGQAKLIDLGLTHMLENPWKQVTRRINMEEYAEEVAHIAPEQAWGCELDARSDIYSLGSTFYSLITGQAAFPGLAGQSMTERQLINIPAPSLVLGDVPADIDELVQQMGAKDPQARCSSAREVVIALHAYLSVDQWSALGLDTTPTPRRRLQAPVAKAVSKPVKEGFFARLMGKLFRK